MIIKHQLLQDIHQKVHVAHDQPQVAEAVVLGKVECRGLLAIHGDQVGNHGLGGTV